MPDLALVVFNEGKNADPRSLAARAGFLKSYSGMALYGLIFRILFNSAVKILQNQNMPEILEIGLPFPKSSISDLNKRYLARCISRICTRNGCDRCFIPSDAGASWDFEQYYAIEKIRPVLFKCLLIPVLNEIYAGQGIRLDSLDIAFVSGENSSELLTMVKELEPFIKFLNIAAEDKQALESGLADLCRESGLSIFIGNDYNSILRNADTIINLGDPAILSNCHIRPHTLVVNYGGTNRSIPRGGFPVINGVEYALQEDQYSLLDVGIRKSYSKAEQTDMLTAMKAGFHNVAEYNDVTAKAVAGVFTSCRCRITGFTGRRGPVRKEEVLKALKIRY